MSGGPPSVRIPDGYRLIRYETVGSTNDEAKLLAREGAPSGTLIWGAAQSQGRGRRGRFWQSPPGNLYLSILLRPSCAAAQAAQLGFVAALALSDALAANATDLRCKWPNDVLVNGLKVAGILLESETGGGDAIDFVVIGIGVNIATAPANTEYPATSLAAEGIADLPPARLLERLVEAFDDWYARWRDEGFEPIREAWLGRATGRGEVVRVRLEGTTLHGRFLDLDGDGALLLESPEGRRRVAAGEVFPAA